MAYDEGLAQRLREHFPVDFEEKKMFGGLAFMVRGHMSLGVNGDELMVRVGPEKYPQALLLPHAREMDFTGKALKGFVYVSADGVAEDEDLRSWIKHALDFNQTQPGKIPKPKTSRGKKSKVKAPPKNERPLVNSKGDSQEMIEVENVNHPGKRSRVNAEKYQAAKKALLKGLPKSGPGLSQAEMFDAAKKHISQSLFPGGAKAQWWLKTVQLDLEAKGMVVREKGRPTRWRKV